MERPDCRGAKGPARRIRRPLLQGSKARSGRRHPESQRTGTYYDGDRRQEAQPLASSDRRPLDRAIQPLYQRPALGPDLRSHVPVPPVLGPSAGSVFIGEVSSGLPGVGEVGLVHAAAGEKVAPDIDRWLAGRRSKLRRHISNKAVGDEALVLIGQRPPRFIKALVRDVLAEFLSQLPEGASPGQLQPTDQGIIELIAELG